MKSKAALIWTKRVVVLNAVASKETMLTVIHEHWKMHNDFILWLRQHELMRTAHASELRGGQGLLQNLMEQIVGIWNDFQVLKQNTLILWRVSK